MNLEHAKLESLKNYFNTQPVLKAYLFGSYVRGQADSDSDIDILVDLDYSQKIGLRFIQMKLDLEKLLNSKVDLVSSNGLSKYIKPIIDTEKLVIYADFRASTSISRLHNMPLTILRIVFSITGPGKRQPLGVSLLGSFFRDWEM